MTDKKSVRSAWHRTLANNPVAPQWGKAAEKLRGLQVYRDAVTVFATPGDSLRQARINCLVDGKNLVMPAPSIREGFFLLPARTVPFKDLSAAVTYKGLEKNGLLLKSDAMPELSMGLLLTDSLAVDLEGGRIGDSNGFFDLCCALLHELCALHLDWAVLTFILEEQISRDALPQDTWDIKMSGAITPEQIYDFNQPPQKPTIFWDMLPQDRIKRINPLWKLFQKRKAKGTGLKV
jgi:5-formyltetrahydrofolate cyclo-ligase